MRLKAGYVPHTEWEPVFLDVEMDLSTAKFLLRAAQYVTEHEGENELFPMYLVQDLEDIVATGGQLA